MQERIEKLISDLAAKRTEFLENYLTQLESFDPQKVYEAAIPFHDIDKHMTNLQIELKRIKAEEAIRKSNEAIVAKNNGVFELEVERG